MSKRRWDEAHASGSCGLHSRLYTDENPATTIKGLGFKNKQIALRTIHLTSQPGARYKQYWTIRAMRERAVSHPHINSDMKEAINVLDEWLRCYKEPTEDERRKQKAEWEIFHKLSSSDANKHSYGCNPSKAELKRARKDLIEGQHLFIELIRSRKNSTDRKPSFHFPLTSFVALFGGPGMHGYGEHSIIMDIFQSEIKITSIEGIVELIGHSKATKLALPDHLQLHMIYDRQRETSRLTLQMTSTNTLKSFWSKSTTTNVPTRKVMSEKLNTTMSPPQGRTDRSGLSNKRKSLASSWSCSSCTYLHNKSKVLYLLCEICGAKRDV